MTTLKISFSPLLKLDPSPNNKRKFRFVDAKSGVELKDYSGECPGVYVWGFMNTDKFIPYYVGEAIDSIFKRIKQHKYDIEKANSTYVRLSPGYMTGDIKLNRRLNAGIAIARKDDFMFKIGLLF